MERIAPAPVGSRRPIRGPKRLLALRSDARLVELVRAGDEPAFEVLYERHIAGVLGFCRHMLGSQHEAEDAVQQAFASAHEAMRRGSREIALKPWLYTIARNRCLSILRARRERPAELPEISTAGLNEQVERSAELRELVADVQRLPEQQRAALVLSELGDLSHAEVAEVIGSPAHAVKGLVFRARAALVERRDARDADCSDIRLELAAATGGGLRRGRLRYHLEACPSCVDYLQEMRRQRKLLGIALPVAPTLALKDSVMSAAGIGAGAGGAGVVAGSGGVGAAAAGSASAVGGAASVGGTLLGGTAVKLAVAGAIVAGGAGVATEVVVRDGGEAPPSKAPSSAREDRPGLGPQGSGGTSGGDRSSAGAAKGRRHSAGGSDRRAVGQRRAERRRGGRSASPPRKALGQERGKAIGRDGARTIGQGRRKVGGDGSRQAPPRGPGASQGGGRGAGGATGGSGGGRGAGQAPVVPRQKAAPGKAAPKATTPPAANGDGFANRPAFQHPAGAVSEQNR